jgi:hypothetical protein
MQEADMRVDALDHFTIEFQDQTQHAVRRWGPKLRMKWRRAGSAMRPRTGCRFNPCRRHRFQPPFYLRILIGPNFRG